MVTGGSARLPAGTTGGASPEPWAEADGFPPGRAVVACSPGEDVRWPGVPRPHEPFDAGRRPDSVMPWPYAGCCRPAEAAPDAEGWDCPQGRLPAC